MLETAEDTPRVLLVDDERAITHTFGQALRLHGYDVTAANDGQRALELFESTRFDALVTDMEMPGLSGRSLVHVAHELNPSAAIILFSAHPRPAALPAWTEFLAKPVSPHTLVGLLRVHGLCAQRALRSG